MDEVIAMNKERVMRMIDLGFEKLLLNGKKIRFLCEKKLRV
jgi:hypothetical protein